MAALALAGGATGAFGATRALCVHDIAADHTLQMRRAPDAGAGIVAELKAGACGLELAGACKGDWCRMTLKGATGWVDTRFVGVYEFPGAAAAYVAPGQARTGSVASLSPPPAPARAALPPPPSGARSPAAVRPPSVVQSPPPLPSRRPAAVRASVHTLPRPRVVERAVVEPDPGRCVVGVEGWDTLRIRSGPGVDHREIGEIPPRACRIEPLGRCDGDWCRISWRGRSGWVNTYYLD